MAWKYRLNMFLTCTTWSMSNTIFYKELLLCFWIEYTASGYELEKKTHTQPQKAEKNKRHQITTTTSQQRSQKREKKNHNKPKQMHQIKKKVKTNEDDGKEGQQQHAYADDGVFWATSGQDRHLGMKKICRTIYSHIPDLRMMIIWICAYSQSFVFRFIFSILCVLCRTTIFSIGKWMGFLLVYSPFIWVGEIGFLHSHLFEKS